MKISKTWTLLSTRQIGINNESVHVIITLQSIIRLIGRLLNLIAKNLAKIVPDYFSILADGHEAWVISVC